jgi:UDP-N-acetylmuramate dehydrogenase
MTLAQHPASIFLGHGAEISAEIGLAEFTTYRVGGPAQWFIAPTSLEQLQESVAWAQQEGLPITVLGAGSNLLISDQGLPGLVIVTRHLRHHSFDETTGQVTAAAGKPVPRLCWQLAKHGWSGFEWAVGVPGTVGGIVVMNAGAHGGSVSDSFVEALVLHPQGQLQTLRREDLAYGYRSSCLQGSSLIVLQAVFELTPGQSPAAIQAQTEVHLNHRLNTQPYEMPSCGSVFRNPLPQSSGWLIEQSGLKGFQMGGAQVAEKHANFIVNRGGATATDIYQLIAHVQKRIESEWGVKLHPEVKILGAFDPVP